MSNMRSLITSYTECIVHQSYVVLVLILVFLEQSIWLSVPVK